MKFLDVAPRMACCHRCGSWGEDVRLRRQNTQYEDDRSNWGTYCDLCQEEADEYWAGMWAELWASCM